MSTFDCHRHVSARTQPPDFGNRGWFNIEDPEEGIYQRMRKVSVKAEDRGEDTQGASGSEAGVISDGRL